jgi:hypothetical protein
MNRYLVQCLLLLCGLLAVRPVAAQIPGPLDERPHLYLVAEGYQSAVPERFLWMLCKLINADVALRERYRSIGVYRVAPDAVEIANQRAREPGNYRLVATRDLVESADERFASSHRCSGETDAMLGPTGYKGTAEVLWLEWVGGSMSGELRAQHGELRRGDAGRPTLGAPQYLRIPASAAGAGAESEDEVAPAIARELGRRFLKVDDRVFDVRVNVDGKLVGKCQARGERCAQLGTPVTAKLVSRATNWASPEEISHEWQLSCTYATGGGVPTTIPTEALHGRELRFVVRDEATCQVGAKLTVGTITQPSKPRTLSFEAPALLVRRTRVEHTLLGIPVGSSLTGPPTALEPLEVDIYERRWLPWGHDSTATTAELWSNLFVLRGEQLLRAGRTLRANLRKLPLPLTGGALATAQRALDERLHQYGDLLAYSVVEGERLCMALNKAMTKRVKHTVIDWQKWEQGCAAAVKTTKNALGTQLKAPARVLISRDSDTKAAIYRGIPALTKATAASLSYGAPAFATRIHKPYRPEEAYEIRAQSERGLPGRAVPLRVKLHAPALKLGYGGGFLYRPVGGGMSFNAFVPFLDQIVTARLEYRNILVRANEPNEGFRLSVGAAILVDVLAIGRTLNGEAAYRPLIAEIGPGLQMDILGNGQRDSRFEFGPVLRHGVRIRTGLGDTGQEFRTGLAAWSPFLNKSVYQAFFEFSIL